MDLKEKLDTLYEELLEKGENGESEDTSSAFSKVAQGLTGLTGLTGQVGNMFSQQSAAASEEDSSGLRKPTAYDNALLNATLADLGSFIQNGMGGNLFSTGYTASQSTTAATTNNTAASGQPAQSTSATASNPNAGSLNIFSKKLA